MLPLLACSGSPIALEGDAPDPPIEQVPGDTSADTGDPPPAHLPIFVIDAEGDIGDTVKTDALLQVVEDHDGTLIGLDDAPRAFAGSIGIEIHGSSSTGYPKLGYKFECRDAEGEDEDCGLVGLPEGSDWVLHAPYADKTYMRNALAYALGRAAAGETRWEPRTRFVELVLDGDYAGVYLLVERISREGDRLDIRRTTDPADGSVDGGFIVKADQHRSDGFDTARGTLIDWVEPKQGEVTPAEGVYLLDWFDRMEAVLEAEDFADPDTGYAAWIDVDAWIDHWLVNELAHNIDAYRLSAFLWTDGPPGVARLRAGPLWDFDRAFGNVNYCDCWTAEGWVYDGLDACGYAYQYPTWWQRLREDPAWNTRLVDRWMELRADAFSDAALSALLAGFRAETAEAETRDHARWGNLGQWVDPNWYVGDTWDDEIHWLEAWVTERAAWMDVHVGEPP